MSAPADPEARGNLDAGFRALERYVLDSGVFDEALIDVACATHPLTS